ncbi:hypothetical protein [Photorhabdus bodei]|uniref:Uncharacterized protein n=1 Tax=Photorhabdus bodei TaxID=2029681 RepID=A0A329X9S3_9GAMM|nr:hypothetical protein [Photorhabdus bodei]NDL00808.1 hypothetical protein [Photorhabdus bodei]NDL04974.1 hypothetical protein [Photorhabdus bodei]NDL09307.1 hypothetical protein [Photorhabdus bodei]RAX13579.1 hypothetical protein CKY02_05530 [Photorhabdus bodei]
MYLYGLVTKDLLATCYSRRSPSLPSDSFPPYLCKRLTEDGKVPANLKDVWCGTASESLPVYTLEWKEKSIRFYDSSHSAILASYVPINPLHIVEIDRRRLDLIQESILQMAPYFTGQLDIIFDFTSTIVWLNARECGFSGAAFHELPHCTFLSDAFFVAVTPSIILAPEHRHYIIFENLYHEALHHQLSASVMLETGGYYPNGVYYDERFYVGSRDKEWSIPNIFQAAYVYLNVLQTRIHYLRAVESKCVEIDSVRNSIEQAIIYIQEMTGILMQDKKLQAEIQNYIIQMNANFKTMTVEYSQI